jgi:hypothetical protein
VGVDHATTPCDPHYVEVCGANLCLDGQPFVIRGATAYGEYGNAASEVALAKQANLNVLELVEFETSYHSLAAAETGATWRRVDQFIAKAGATGLHVILNLSEYGQSLLADGKTPTTTNWDSYLRFIADRRNTVTGVLYKDDPAIAMVELFGEIDAPNSGADPGAAGTTAQLNAFFSRTLTQWHTLAPHILVSTGGFSYINEANNGIDWQAIVQDRYNATCDVEVNSANDLAVSVPAVSSFCSQLGKPWFLAAWSACYADPANGYDYFGSDVAMAAHASAMYALAHGGAPAAAPAVGTDFWNLAGGPVVTDSCNIGPEFPLTFAAIQAG